MTDKQIDYSGCDRYILSMFLDKLMKEANELLKAVKVYSRSEHPKALSRAEEYRSRIEHLKNEMVLINFELLSKEQL